ncbi:hypothetical protein HF086_005964 [Spodoptera exigua]|uniref:Uncharacterized protein n=1 Tax=Spodoptera exigua TaxID=7107 RepID=A0A922M730_SPOEX|nr:hypothetical protein HF086_005964 [Spodoptera exigua]
MVKLTGRFGQHGFHRQAVLFGQDVDEIAEQLPLRMSSAGQRLRRFSVNIPNLRAVLDWLISNNPLYANVTINFNNDNYICHVHHNNIVQDENANKSNNGTALWAWVLKSNIPKSQENRLDNDHNSIIKISPELSPLNTKINGPDYVTDIVLTMLQGENRPDNLVENIHLNMRGSNVYWQRACSNLIAMILKLWKGNMDIQSCGNVTAISYCIAKYTSKHEPKDVDVKLYAYSVLLNGNVMKKRRRSAMLRTRYYTLMGDTGYFYNYLVAHLPFRDESGLLTRYETCEEAFMAQRNSLRPFHGDSIKQFQHLNVNSSR